MFVLSPWKKKCIITTTKRGNVTETVIESNSPELKTFFDKMRVSKTEKQARLRSVDQCNVIIKL